ncbi:MAG: type secretion system protein TrbL [Solirubrobacteraceae bacterium]|jgi:hypothetical protein|nr:type secretion system protein TrbL [Solirubrobacteraceae bacterium]
MTRWSTRTLAPAILVVALALCASPPPARAFDPTKPICTLAGLVSGLAGKVCSAARHAGRVLKAGQKLLGGHLGRAAETLSGGGTATKAITATAALTAMAVWVTGGARLVLHETAAVIASTTRPQLESTWFSSSYWRMAGISALLTLPFLFAAAVQALIRSDASLLARSVFGYLPLCGLAVAVAAPVTQLLLAASDELSSLVASASSYSSTGFVHVTSVGAGLGVISSFPVFFVGLLAVAATVTLWIELLIRSAAVYVIVLMLPLFFAALVWPARRIWAMRAIELLIALILSKFAIVAVLALGGAALGHTAIPSVTQMLAGTTLVLLAAFTPWALLRLLPLHELAAGVEGMRGAGTRGLAAPDAGAVNAYDRTETFGDELAEAHAQRHQGEAGQTSGARSALEGLNVGNAQAATEPSGEPDSGGEPDSSGNPGSGGAAGSVPGPGSSGEALTLPAQSAAPSPDPTPPPHDSTPPPTDPTPPPHDQALPPTDPQTDAATPPDSDEPWARRNLTWPYELGPDTAQEASLDPSGQPEDAPERR